MTGRIECETAAQCREIAAMMESTIVPLVMWTVIGVALLFAAHALYQNRARGDFDE